MDSREIHIKRRDCFETSFDVRFDYRYSFTGAERHVIAVSYRHRDYFQPRDWTSLQAAIRVYAAMSEESRETEVTGIHKLLQTY